METTQVSIEQLWNIVGGGTRFTLDEIILSGSESLTAGEDMRFIHHDRMYVVKNAELVKYFELHPKPSRKLTVEQENALLNEKIKRLEDEIAMMKAGGRNIKPEPDLASFPTPVKDDEEDETAIIEADKPLFAPAVTRERPERMTPDEIKKSLAEDLKKVNPLRARKE